MPSTVDRVFRDFKRFTGDGLPNEPVGRPLPVGDPASGAHNPSKAEIRSAFDEPISAAEDAADRAEVAASILGVEACTFHPRDYIAEAQMVHILNNDTASQNEATVTAGLRAMHDAGMDWVRGAANRSATFIYSGTYAVNDEMFTETFAGNLWLIGYNRGAFHFIGPATFKVKNWSALARVRTTGQWQGVTDVVPTAVFRWEQQTGYQVGPFMTDLRFEGTAGDATPAYDPIGIKISRANGITRTRVDVFNIKNIGLMTEGVVNSRDVQCVVEGCGYQPTNSGGTGFIPTTATFSVTGTALTASEAVFDAADVNKIFLVHEAGQNGHVHRAFITAYTSPTAVTLVAAAPNAVSGTQGSFGVLSGTIAAGSSTLTLNATMTDSMVGRYVTVMFAGSTLTPSYDHLVTRVTAQAGSVLTLASPAQFTATAVPIIVAPAEFMGRTTDDYPRNGGRVATPANDIQSYGMRNENPQYQGRGSAVNLFVNGALNVSWLGGKLHGQPPIYNNFGANFAIVIADFCEGTVFRDVQLKWGKYSGTYGSVIVTGAACSLALPGAQIGNNFAADNARHLYLAPRAGATGWHVSIDGLDQSGNGWPNAGQGLVRYGPNGTAINLIATGPLVKDGVTPGRNPEEPIHHMRDLRVNENMGVGGDPSETETTRIRTAHTGDYNALEMARGGDDFIYRVTSAGHFIGKTVSGTTVYPFQITWAAPVNSFVIGDDFVQVRKPRLTGLPSYANNAAAITGGLVAGDAYLVSASNPRQLAVVF